MRRGAIPDRTPSQPHAALTARLISSAARLERIASDHFELPGFCRLAYRDLAAKCRAEAASLLQVAA